MNHSESSTALVKSGQQELNMYNQARHVAGLCKDIVIKKAVEIEGRKFVPVEAWTTIAVAHSCIATIKEDSVQEVYDRNGNLKGIRAIAEIRRQSDGALLTSAEGFVGVDEFVWFGGIGKRWNRVKRVKEDHQYEKRNDYAIRAMAQTRAVSRACRTAFSHVVVLMDAGLETVPLEEVQTDADERGDAGSTGEIDRRQEAEKERKVAEMLAKNAKTEKNVTGTAHEEKKETAAAPASAAPANTAPNVPRDVPPELRNQFRDGKWKVVMVHFGADEGKKLGEMPEKKLTWWVNDWQPVAFGTRPISEQNKLLRAALDVAGEEALAH